MGFFEREENVFSIIFQFWTQPLCEPKNFRLVHLTAGINRNGTQEAVKQWLKQNRITYNAEKFVEEVQDVEDLELLDHNVKDIFPDMTTSDAMRIEKAVKKMTRLRSSS